MLLERNKSIFIIVLLFVLFASILVTGVSANQEENSHAGVSPVRLEQYNQLCGNCHFAYQPGLLPGSLWDLLMQNSQQHFGRALNLSPVEHRTIKRYLYDNSAGHVKDEISEGILQSMSYDRVLIRVTQTPYFIKRHSDVNMSP